MATILETTNKLSKWDSAAIRAEFPILQQKIHGKPLVYLDNSATTQKPWTVINALQHYYSHNNANVHRGIHQLGERASVAYDNARHAVKDFINAKQREEIIFVRGTTEGINLVAQSYAAQFKTGDEIIISAMEHHSNLVPWQNICKQTGAVLRIIPIIDQGEIDFNAYESLLNVRTKLVAIAHISNALGTINPVKKIIRAAHAKQIPVLLDGAQAAAHLPLDMQELDCDFYSFSGHKMYAPMGIGVLYVKADYLEKMQPYQTGGGMINQVSWQHTDYLSAPEKFEAGTPNVEGAVGLHAAIDYLTALGLKNIAAHEQDLLLYATAAFKNISGLNMVGNAAEKTAVIAFTMNHIHPHDIASILDSEGIAIRAGHHCAMPLMQRLGLPATARVSLGIYNTVSDIDACIMAIEKVKQVFK